MTDLDRRTMPGTGSMVSMQAVRLPRFGGPEVLSLDELPWPQPQDDEVLVRIRAASVNPVDYKTRAGSYPAVKAEDLPVVLGRDLAGTVELCGTRAHTLKKGDEIFALLGRDRGAYAEYVVVKAAEMAPKPRNLGFVEAAAVPLAGLTAWQGLFDQGDLVLGGLKAGQRVLIHGGAGGVGHLAVQFAKAKGAWVATTVSGEDVEFARGLGADQVIDHKAQRFEDAVEKVDLVFDLIAGDAQERSWAVLKPGGALVSTLQKPDEARAREHGVRAANYMAQPNAAQLKGIGDLIEAGRVKVTIQATYPLEQAAEAQRRMEQEHTRGKVVLEVAG